MGSWKVSLGRYKSSSEMVPTDFLSRSAGSFSKKRGVGPKPAIPEPQSPADPEVSLPPHTSVFKKHLNVDALVDDARGPVVANYPDISVLFQCCATTRSTAPN